jgi:hypothetical protein
MAHSSAISTCAEVSSGSYVDGRRRGKGYVLDWRRRSAIGHVGDIIRWRRISCIGHVGEITRRRRIGRIGHVGRVVGIIGEITRRRRIGRIGDVGRVVGIIGEITRRRRNGRIGDVGRVVGIIGEITRRRRSVGAIGAIVLARDSRKEDYQEHSLQKEGLHGSGFTNKQGIIIMEIHFYTQ